MPGFCANLGSKKLGGTPKHDSSTKLKLGNLNATQQLDELELKILCQKISQMSPSSSHFVKFSVNSISSGNFFESLTTAPIHVSVSHANPLLGCMVR